MLTVDFATRHTHTHTQTPTHCHKNINAYLPVPANPPPLLHCLPYLRTQSFGLDLRAWGANWQFLWNCTNTYEPVLLFFMANYTAAYECVQQCVCVPYICVSVCVCRHVIKTFGSLRYQRVLWLVFSRNPLEKGQQKTKEDCKKSNTQNK